MVLHVLELDRVLECVDNEADAVVRDDAHRDQAVVDDRPVGLDYADVELAEDRRQVKECRDRIPPRASQQVGQVADLPGPNRKFAQVELNLFTNPSAF